MKLQLKKLSEQVVVITGASSGIGLVTARMAAEKGAKLVIASRNGDALAQIVDEINAKGGQATYVVADVGIEADVQKIAQAAIDRFGGFDTWINNAGTGAFGKILDGDIEDYRRLYETNVWGVVYGSLTAARHFIARGTPSALITVGSSVGDRAVAYQGVYSSSKFAVKGFTEALRTELEADNAPISITLIKPAAINTPFPEHARNYFDEQPTLPPPVYAPDLVANAILHCAETPTRDMIVGSGGKTISDLGNNAPEIGDRLMETATFRSLQTQHGVPARNPEGALHAPTTGGQERGDYPGHTRETSFYTAAKLHPAITGALAAVAGVTLAALIANRKAPDSRN